MLINDFDIVIDEWIKSVWDCSPEELYIQPAENSWSIGQVCMHLVNDTDWFIEQIKICRSDGNNRHKAMDETAKIIFVNNAFPDEKITNPANQIMPQPESKADLLKLLFRIKTNMIDVVLKNTQTDLGGKTQHPGMGYFNANEWLQFTTMHLRHHLKQKKRIEDYFNLHKY